MLSELKTYADSLYDQSLQKSIKLLREEELKFRYEVASRNPNSYLPPSGPEIQMRIGFHVKHIERSMAARLESYRAAYGEAGKTPTDQEFIDILNDINNTQKSSISHSAQAILAVPGVLGRTINASNGLTANSAHGHDRVLQDLKVWRGQAHLKAVTQDSAPAPILAPLRDAGLPEIKEQSSYLSFGDSLASVGLILMIVFIIFTPSLWWKVALLILCVPSFFVFARKSNWTHSWHWCFQYGCALLITIAVASAAAPQLMAQWRTEHPLGTKVAKPDPQTPQQRGPIPPTPESWHTEDKDGKPYVEYWDPPMDPNCKAHPERTTAKHRCQFSQTQIHEPGDPTAYDTWNLYMDAPGPVYEVGCDPTGQHEIKPLRIPQGNTGLCSGEINGGDAEIRMYVKWKEQW